MKKQTEEARAGRTLLLVLAVEEGGQLNPPISPDPGPLVSFPLTYPSGAFSLPISSSLPETRSSCFPAFLTVSYPFHQALAAGLTPSTGSSSPSWRPHIGTSLQKTR